MLKKIVLLLCIYLASSAYLRKDGELVKKDFATDYLPINEEESFFISYPDNLRKDVKNNENFDVVYEEKMQ
jgi:hypothetical protein